jgi:hypothetical protein
MAVSATTADQAVVHLPLLTLLSCCPEGCTSRSQEMKMRKSLVIFSFVLLGEDSSMCSSAHNLLFCSSGNLPLWRASVPRHLLPCTDFCRVTQLGGSSKPSLCSRVHLLLLHLTRRCMCRSGADRGCDSPRGGLVGGPVAGESVWLNDEWCVYKFSRPSENECKCTKTENISCWLHVSWG